MKRVRQSNIELLRIISMIMILCVHFAGATFGLPSIMTISETLSLALLAKEGMESFAIIGVNCFVLISGYFGIKPSVKGIVNFILWCMFYSVLIYSIYVAAEPKYYNSSDIINSFAIFSHTDLWFVPAYFMLYLVSPVINGGLKDLSKRKFVLLLIALTFINVYLGWFWQGKVNPTGYNVTQLIFIYIIGRFLRKHVSHSYKYCKWYLLCYILSFILIFASTFFFKSAKAFAYNSPYVIMASVFFFLIFTTFRFHNQYINFIASSAFAVYLIHKMPPIWNDLKTFLIDNTNGLSYGSFFIYWILFVSIIFTISITIDKVRMSIMNPIVNRLSNLIKRII